MSDDRLGEVVTRVRELRAGYTPPDFGHVPDPDSALFLCAVDHKAGYQRPHRVEGRGPFRGSALLWELGLRTARERPGWLTAAALQGVDESEVAEGFRIDGETVADPARRAALWGELATGLVRDHEGGAERLLAASGSRLGGEAGLLERLSRYHAFSDPLAKKAQLFAKIAERRGWFEVSDPEAWQVSADSVLMRLALRSGLVVPGELASVREQTLDAFARVATASRIAPPVLDDMLWELGREDSDLLGRFAGDLSEPPRNPGSAWY